MRLTHLKLAGFKSFVDPTTVHVPGQLVAICGPNGCGKSNVIDAVRWVLGESSAKQLRGESMQDVIFNGSGARKPVSRAAVELVFDNAAGLAAGQWSQYAEISIKRVLTRQGESSYYINNLQVRRRDITDLFLGTGVGKGGYAIIEQGMISRIIEAKPEELRHFLEEAAGVSKYKERRRETEARLADTRDNLSRVEDIARELGAQIAKLETQAEVAAEYNRLQAAVTEKQNLLALQRKLDAARDAEAARREIDAAQNALEAQLAQLRALEAALEQLREDHFTASDAVHQAQGELYDANAAVARLEQQLLHLKQTRERLTQQLQEAGAELGRLDAQDRVAGDELEIWRARHEEANYAAEESALALDAQSERLPELEGALRLADDEFNSLRERLASARNTVQLARQQAQHLERTLAQLRERRQRLLAEHAALAPAHDEAREALIETRAAAALAQEQGALALAEGEARLAQARTRQQQARAAREALSLELAGLTAREAALGELTRTGDADGLASWLAAQELAQADVLLDVVRVQAGWETALEAALGARLQARLAQTPPQAVAPAPLVLALPAQPASAGHGLRAKVTSDHATANAALDDWLAGIDCAESLADALARRTTLPPGRRLATRDGHLVGRAGIVYHAADGHLAGMVARRVERDAIRERLATLHPALADAEETLTGATQALEEAESMLPVARQQVQAAQQQLAQCERELARRDEAHQQAGRRQQQLADELAQLDGQLEDETIASLACEERRLQAEDELAPLEDALHHARLTRTEAESACELQRSRLRQAERQAQEARFAVQAAQQKLAELARRGGDLGEQRQRLLERREALALELEHVDEGQFDVGFQAAVDTRAQKERALAAARDALNGLTGQLREREGDKQRIEAGLEPAREAVGNLRLKEQEARLAAERFAQELAEAGADETALRERLGTGLKVSSLAAEIGRLSQALSGLGAVNLAALEELEAARTRQGWLQAQSADLTEAIGTLENAIRRIDRETRALLQETYDAVNANLQELFPMLFGGGHAELVLTGEEILDAGLTIMAQPPGKKNSTIHLLSGGEKALTALSLVFSLFRLNPAPFCLLDEVDAPLDDANTLRFCHLVKKMAERTQFLYISHNRLTMEMASQLVGVTMQEQGVSRVVAVDIEAALSMRESAPV
ncbi:chromosome segregation protein SMC [Chitiniphilus purpureus]|uniref:Chromosome partition protein Smc n=1 Tax=Chitiniphilus purpureus TaxID=2981137 RepID=A0ABY6DLK4_9NEIS|nr:chromosome segregation protein SMC [Chitiniphilus sp. CD1]UXY14001.1 chromosome segregation protein SMC [Chitiniphilus sp. CD1]